MSEFARKQLEKYGWSEGKGLGKEENGIVNPIKSKLKFDNQGLGHDNVKKVTSAWWCDMFNDASKRILVKNSEDGVQISNEKRSIESALPSTALIHKKFVKANNLEESADGLLDEKLEEKHSSTFNDSLFKKCEGTKKTCFNYSLMKGKIERIKKQDAMFKEKLRRKNKSKCKGKKLSR